jgi:hypothetical protein
VKEREDDVECWELKKWVLSFDTIVHGLSSRSPCQPSSLMNVPSCRTFFKGNLFMVGGWPHTCLIGFNLRKWVSTKTYAKRCHETKFIVKSTIDSLQIVEFNLNSKLVSKNLNSKLYYILRE